MRVEGFLLGSPNSNKDVKFLLKKQDKNLKPSYFNNFLLYCMHFQLEEEITILKFSRTVSKATLISSMLKGIMPLWFSPNPNTSVGNSAQFSNAKNARVISPIVK
jgi:hypothetical protein